jgi:membrane-associated protease RseP (regulator of RpoE activity)
MMMDSRISRGAVAALFGFGVALPLRGQGAASGPAKVPDTSRVRIVMSGEKRIPLDSIAILMRAFDQEPLGSQAMRRLREKIDRMATELAATHLMFGETMREGNVSILPEGWIGINALGPRQQFMDPSGLNVEYFDYQPIVSVDPESPAQRAGVASGDVLVAYNGVDLKGHRFNLTRMFTPDEKLSVTVRREGETKDFNMIVAKTPQQILIRRRDLDALPDGDAPLPQAFRRSAFPSGTLMIGGQTNGEIPGNFMFRIMPAQNGVFGARVLTLSPELAKKLNLSEGLLIDEVPEETPAFKSGLRTGDVIVSASGQPVSSVKRLLELLMMRDTDRRAALVVMRDGKSRAISVSW